MELEGIAHNKWFYEGKLKGYARVYSFLKVARSFLLLEKKLSLILRQLCIPDSGVLWKTEMLHFPSFVPSEILTENSYMLSAVRVSISTLLWWLSLYSHRADSPFSLYLTVYDLCWGKKRKLFKYNAPSPLSVLLPSTHTCFLRFPPCYLGVDFPCFKNWINPGDEYRLGRHDPDADILGFLLNRLWTKHTNTKTYCTETKVSSSKTYIRGGHQVYVWPSFSSLSHFNTLILKIIVHEGRKLKVPGVVLGEIAVLPSVVWPGVLNACSDTTWTDSDAMNKRGYQARPGFTLWTLKIVQTKLISSAPLQSVWKWLFDSGAKLGATYLVCACCCSFGRTAAWCGVGVAWTTNAF